MLLVPPKHQQQRRGLESVSTPALHAGPKGSWSSNHRAHGVDPDFHDFEKVLWTEGAAGL